MFTNKELNILLALLEEYQEADSSDIHDQDISEEEFLILGMKLKVLRR